jgi:hypothetical protein
VGHDAISDVVRKTLLTYWNTISFHALYAEASNFELSQSPALKDRSLMDRWIISELNALVAEVDSAYNDFDSQAAGKVLARFLPAQWNYKLEQNEHITSMILMGLVLTGALRVLSVPVFWSYQKLITLALGGLGL